MPHWSNPYHRVMHCRHQDGLGRLSHEWIHSRLRQGARCRKIISLQLDYSPRLYGCIKATSRARLCTTKPRVLLITKVQHIAVYYKQNEVARDQCFLLDVARLDDLDHDPLLLCAISSNG